MEPTGQSFDRVQDPETGMFERLREWNDLFPWFRLTRTLRMAASPPLVLLTIAAVGIWLAGQWMILGDRIPLAGVDHGGQGAWGAAYRPARWFTGLAYLTSPSTLHQLPARSVGWRWLLGSFWSLLIWTPLGLLLARQGALLTAGRPMVGLKSGLQLAVQRMMRAWVVALVPLLCVAAISLLLFLAGKLALLLEGVPGLEMLAAVIVAILAIPCGLLAFGSHFAIPLGWAALVNEQHPDPLDSLSRGYEYFLRRPLQLVGYCLLALLLLSIIGLLAAGVSASAISVTTAVLGMGSDGNAPMLVRRVAALLSWFPVAVMVTLAWGLSGGIYLLLRRDAGGQEVEDVWLPPSDPQPPLPSLPRS